MPFSQPPIFPDITSLSCSEQLALLGFVTGSRHSACVGSRQLASSLACFAGVAGSLAGAQAQLSLLGRSALCRFARPCVPGSHCWLAARVAGSLCSAYISSRQLPSLDSRCFAHIVSQVSLGFARLGSLARIAQLCLACIAGWLASSLACVAGIAGSLTGVRC